MQEERSVQPIIAAGSPLAPGSPWNSLPTRAPRRRRPHMAGPSDGLRRSQEPSVLACCGHGEFPLRRLRLRPPALSARDCGAAGGCFSSSWSSSVCLLFLVFFFLDGSLVFRSRSLNFSSILPCLPSLLLSSFFSSLPPPPPLYPQSSSTTSHSSSFFGPYLIPLFLPCSLSVSLLPSPSLSPLFILPLP